jgi:hypothetical protein
MISKHVSYREGTRSNTAERLDINNTPNDEQLKNMEITADNVFEPLREWVGGPVKVNSFFRCLELNVAMQMVKQMAQDIRVEVQDQKNRQL